MRGEGFEPANSLRADLESASVGHLDTPALNEDSILDVGKHQALQQTEKFRVPEGRTPPKITSFQPQIENPAPISKKLRIFRRYTGSDFQEYSLISRLLTSIEDRQHRESSDEVSLIFPVQ